MGKASRKKKEIVEKKKTLLLLDLGCGDSKREGYKGVDKFKTPSVDYVHDLCEFPWPFEDGSVEDIHCSHFFEHIPNHLRGKFMDEVYRILVWDGKARFIVPYWSSMRSIQDFTHQWPPLCEVSFMYFNKSFRVGNRLTHGYYDLTCDFDFSWGYVIDQGLTTRSEEYRQHVLAHEVNVISDVDITLVKAVRK